MTQTLALDLIVDTRETKPWQFNIKLPSKIHINSITNLKLDAGDYSLADFHNPDLPYSICIERKQSLEEFLGNLGKHWNRFERELQRLSQYSLGFIVVEDDLKTAYSRFRNSPYFNLPPEFVLKKTTEIYYEYGIVTHFMSNRTYAQKFTANLFKYFVLNYGGK